VREICWRFIELLKSYSVIWQNCTLQTWCDIKYNTVLCWAKILSVPISNACVEKIFSILDNTWTDRRNRMTVELVKSELCSKFNFDMTCADFIDFLNKPEQVELLKSVSKNKKYKWKLNLFLKNVILFIIYVIFQYMFCRKHLLKNYIYYK
jgi:hypothetical protein